MKAYKGFDKDLKCRGFQYEVGKEYEEGSAELCKKGFHACENPLDTFRYYGPTDSRYCEVDVDDNGERNGDDSKVCGKHIKIGAEIGLKGVINAGVRFVFDKCESATEENASGVTGNAAASGWRGTADASGRCGKASAAGKQCIAVAWGVDSYARGEIGTWIVVAEHDGNGNIINAAMAKVDGDTIKADTWYTMQYGKIVEVEE